MRKLETLQDFAIATEGRLGLGLADYIGRAAGQGNTSRSNIHAFCYYDIVSSNRMQESANYPQTAVKIFGKDLAMPVMIAPTAWHGMYTPKGESATSAAARKVGTNYIISSFSTLDFSQIDSQLSHTWYQLLMYKDLGLMKHYIDKALNAGCSAIVLTVDAVMGCSMCKRDPAVPAVEFPVHKLPIFPEDPAIPYSTLDQYYERYMPMRLNWEDIREIVLYAKVPVILKGVLSHADVLKAIDAGANAVIISNHGGRQNDKLPATLDALVQLPPTIKEQIDIYLDGGVRNGEDVFKALALGAKAVLIGRPAIYGLAADGERGLVQVLQTFKNDLSECMVKARCRTLEDIGPGNVVRLE